MQAGNGHIASDSPVHSQVMLQNIDRKARVVHQGARVARSKILQDATSDLEQMRIER